LIKKIGILTFWEFPEGMAPTTRILALSKGLVANNIEVEIFSFRRIFESDLSSQNIVKKGVIDNIWWTYVHFFDDLGKKYKIFRIIDEIILRIKLVFLIFHSHRRKEFDCFLFSFDDNHTLSVYSSIFKLFYFPVFLVADEYPIPIRDFMMDEVPDKMLKKYCKNHKFFSGRILMSEALKKFYNEKVSEKPTFILNTVIDRERFDNLKVNIVGENYICYMGNMGLTKDDVGNIVKAFSLIQLRYADLQLHLYGTPSSGDKKIILDMINNLGLQNKILFKGRAKYTDVPTILNGAKILVNAQPKTKRSEGGFPTKLGEYLLTGKPAIFTNSGDISKYITDDEHAFIVEPENELEYANKIIKILDNYDNALKIGNSGKKLILENFDAIHITSELLKFLSKNGIKINS
jgi:glycosyltransferase involved in cell wall biosynthesis